jgi:hypothetical protein
MSSLFTLSVQSLGKVSVACETTLTATSSLHLIHSYSEPLYFNLLHIMDFLIYSLRIIIIKLLRSFLYDIGVVQKRHFLKKKTR